MKRQSVAEMEVDASCELVCQQGNQDCTYECILTPQNKSETPPGSHANAIPYTITTVSTQSSRPTAESPTTLAITNKYTTTTPNSTKTTNLTTHASPTTLLTTITATTDQSSTPFNPNVPNVTSKPIDIFHEDHK